MNTDSEDRKRKARYSTDSDNSIISSPSDKQLSKKLKDQPNSPEIHTDKMADKKMLESLKLALQDPDIIRLITNATVTALQGEINNLKEEITEKDKKITKLEGEVEELEMYGRRNGIRVFGVPEKPGESTDAIVLKVAEKIGAEIPPIGLGRSHRVGKPGGTGPRPIIAKFISHNLKVNMMKMKSNLNDIHNNEICEGSGQIFINEDLTQLRANWAKRGRDLKRGKKVGHTWSRDGIIFIKEQDNSIPVRISTEKAMVEAEEKFAHTTYVPPTAQT